ncbi:Ig-like domain-containing protein [Pontibacter kalidii]|uniref:Ig-like domain-containing protein n=1 Tax=Pontibacter kalidii TaxID=2592049 RepID=UPI0022535830|nr:Ig-like domain-containing protein [Pontibacter kalidii]
MKTNTLKALMLIAVLLYLCVQPLLAQTPVRKVWDKRYGGSGNDAVTAIVNDNDGGYIIGGVSNSLESGGDKSSGTKGKADFWVVKVNSSGEKVWDRTLGGSGVDFLTSITLTPDGGFLLGGRSDSGVGGDKTEASRGSNDFWVVKMNAAGEKVWDRTYGGEGDDGVRVIATAPDGGYLLSGYSSSDISGDKNSENKGSYDYWIVKIDANGKKIWDKSFGGLHSEDQYAGKTIPLTGGGYLIGGASNSGVSGDKSESSRGYADYWVVKVNSAGEKVWDKTFGGMSSEELYGLAETGDGGYLLSGWSTSGIEGDKTAPPKGRHRAYWVIKIDAAGTKVWDKTFGGSDNDEPFALAPTPDGGFLLGGRSDSGVGGDKTEASRGGYDFWVVKMNAAGEKVWDKTYGGSDDDGIQAIAVTPDGQFIVGGYSHSGASGDRTEESRGGGDFWVVKFAEGSAPVITAHPTSRTITGGQNTSFTVTANGTDLAYQWQVSKDGGNTFSNISNGLGYSGATTATLAITKAPISMNGYRYRVMVSNGTVSTSTTAMLTVNLPGFNNSRVWQPIGTSGFSTGQASWNKVIIDANGTPYVAFTDVAREGRITVMKYNGSVWTVVGAPGFSGRLDPGLDNLSFALDRNGVPYVAYEDEDNGRNVSVMKFDGVRWVYVGTAGIAVYVGSSPSLAFSTDNTPYLAYSNYTGVGYSGKAIVKKFNGRDWENVGDADFSAGHASGLSLAFDTNGTPYVAFSESPFGTGEADYKTTVMKFNDTDWENVGAPRFSPGYAMGLSLALDANGTPYLAYYDKSYGDHGGQVVRKFDGSNWVSTGGDVVSFGGSAVNISLTVDTSGVPYIAFEETNNPTLMRFDGTSWIKVNRSGLSKGMYTYASLDANDVPYIAYSDEISGKATVMKFTPVQNARPSNIDLSNSSVEENMPANTLVGTFITTDADAGDTHTYTLVAGEGSSGNAAFTIDGDKLKILQSPDYEIKNSYSIRVRTDDGKPGGTFEKVFVIQVTDVEEVPSAFEVYISSNNADSTMAKVGDVVLVHMHSFNPDQIRNGVATIAGHTTTPSGGMLDNTFRYTMTAQDAEGVIPFTLTFYDVAISKEVTVTAVTRGKRVVFDKTPPSPSITSTVSGTTNKGVIPLTLTFSEAVTDLEASDFKVVNGSVSRISTTNNVTYTVDFTPSASGAVSVTLPAGKVKDAASNLNTASNTWTASYDGTRPTVTLSTQAPEVMNVPFTVSFTFSKAVTGFAVGDITVENGTASSFTVKSSTTYEAKITPASQGQVRVNVAADVAQDAAKNGNTASSVLTRTYDSLAPTGYAVAFNQTVINYGNERSASVKVTGAEVGATYSYAITSAGGGTAVSGTGQAGAATFDIPNLNLSGLGNGQLTLVLRMTDAASNAGPEAKAQVMKHSRNLNSYTKPAEIRVPFRTTFGRLKTLLPSQVEVTYSDNTKGMVSVAWQEGAYDGTMAGSYTLSGTLTPAEGTTNLDNIAASVTVVVGASRAATAIALSRSDMDENNEVGAEIGTLSASDPDQGDTHTFALVAGEGAADNASFTIEDSVLKAAVAFDYETRSSYSIRIRTTDSGGASFEAIHTITVNDVEDVVTGIAEKEDTMLKIYPNPTSRYMVVSFDKVMDSVSLVSGTGSVVLREEGRFTQARLDTDALAPGVYVVMIHAQGKVYTKRILVSK